MSHLETNYSESIARIDLASLEQNLEFLKRKSGTDKVMAVVKANAYGHGVTDIASFLENKVSQFAVATLDEGIQLRKSGIETPILVFGVPKSGYASAYKHYNLTATISQASHFGLLNEGTEYHLIFDTGMRRNGFYANEVEEVLQNVKKYSNLKCRGIYSHYSTADEPGSDFVLDQFTRFNNIRKHFPDDITAHMSNTAAVLHYDVDHFNMLRPGLGLLGYAPGKVQSEDLQPVLNWETEVVLIRSIRKGDRVSYGGTWTAPRDGYLATLPVGYGDGIPRALSNRLEVRINDKFYPVVGNVTMDFCMVFPGNNKIKTGSTVHLLGIRGWRANTWAEKAGSITHEILCGLTPRIKRFYQLA